VITPGSGRLELRMNTSTAIAALGFGIDRPDLLGELLIGHLARTWLPAAPGIKPAGRDVEHRTQARHRVVRLLLGDELVALVPGSAKMATAFFLDRQT
jgi:hypothetical protein